MPTDFETLETPLPLVDLDRLQRNMVRMAEYSAEHGLALRPHIKTHKSPLIAGEQMLRGAIGLTCATTSEIAVMAEASRDVLLAFPPVGPGRLRRLMEAAESLRLTVMLDSEEALELLAAAASQASIEVDVLVELDVGMKRVGVQQPAGVISLARQIEASPSLRYAGIGFYPGHIRTRVTEQQEEIQQLNQSVSAALAELERVGLAPRVVSGGSTPTAWRSHQIDGLTEIRPGTYVYNDRTTAELGACAWHECALSVLATVVSLSVPGQAVVDAGSKALGREPLKTDGQGYGALLDRPEVVVTRMSEEHGILDLSHTDWKPRIGTQVRIVPNHACIVSNLFDKVIGVRGDAVMTRWPVAARGH